MIYRTARELIAEAVERLDEGKSRYGRGIYGGKNKKWLNPYPHAPSPDNRPGGGEPNRPVVTAKEIEDWERSQHPRGDKLKEPYYPGATKRKRKPPEDMPLEEGSGVTPERQARWKRKGSRKRLRIAIAKGDAKEADIWRRNIKDAEEHIRQGRRIGRLDEGAPMEKAGFASMKGQPKKAARKLAYELARGRTSGGVQRWSRKGISHMKRMGRRLTDAMGQSGLSEGAVKASMEDWLTDLPKPVVAELKAKHGKHLAHTGGEGYRDIGTNRTARLHQSIKNILHKHDVPKLLGSHAQGSHAIQMSFHTFHG